MLILTLCVVLCKKQVLPTQKKRIQQSKYTIMTVLKGVHDIYDLRVNFITQCWILHAICIWSFQCSFSERGSWLPPQVQMWCIYAEGAPWAPLLLPLIDRLCDLNGLFACVHIYILRVFPFTECVLLIFDYDTARVRLKMIKCSLTLKNPQLKCWSPKVGLTAGDTASNPSEWLRRGRGQSR